LHPMGIFSRKPVIVEAQLAPQVMGENLPSIYNYIIPRISRKDAMSVPSVARARNLICGTVASIPLEYYNKSTGEVIAPPRWINQLAKNQPSFVTLTWIVDSLLFYGISYLRVTERYAEDGRPSAFEWIANARVTFTTDLEGIMVTQYYVDAAPIDMNDIVTIQGFDEGVVAAVKQTTPVNKAKLLRMATIAEKAKQDAIFGSTNRPADVAGDSLAQRIKTIRSVNREAGQQLDGVAKSLRGQKGDLTTPSDNFAKNLNEMGVQENGDGSLNFIGSDIEGIAGAEKILKQVASRVRKLDADDAYDMHRLKRYIDEQVTYGKSTEGLSGKAERTLKSLRADIDASLDAQFPEYNRVNTQYADTIGALDAFQDAAGTKVNLFGENSEKALGTVSRRLLSNTQSRVNLIDSIKNIDDVAKKYGTTFDDDIMTQVLFADELDKVFGAAARTSLQGDVGKGVKRGLETATGQRTLTGIGIDAASAAVEKARGINEQNAFKSIKELLAREAKK